MTRNNLDEHLSWLLHAKPSVPANAPIYPPASSGPAAVVVVPQARGIVAQSLQRVPPILSAASGPSETQPAPTPRTLPAPEPVRAQPSDNDMARLRTAPGSSSKPKFTTALPGFQQTTSATIEPAGVTRRQYGAGPVSAQTPSAVKPLARMLTFPGDVEILDMTNGTNASAKPTPSRLVAPSSSRKRKSDEFMVDGARKEPRIASTTSSHTNRGGHEQPSPGFATIDELDRQCPTEPPPPYSTVPPTVSIPSSAEYESTGAVARNVLQQTSGVRAGRIMPDSEDDEDIIVFTAPGSRRKVASSGPSSSKSAVRRRPAIIQEDSPTKRKVLRINSQPTNTDVARPISGNSDARPPSPAKFVPPKHATQTTATQPEPDQQCEHLPPQDVSSLKTLLSCNDEIIQTVIDELQAKSESIQDEASRIIDADMDARDELKKMDFLDAAIVNVTDLLLMKQVYPSVKVERQQAYDAMKASLRTRQGMQGAREANAGCKKKLEGLEKELAAALNTCREHLQETLDAARRASVAVQSTQAFPLDKKVQETVVPSSSRIAQTQMVKQSQQVEAQRFRDGTTSMPQVETSTSLATPHKQSNPRLAANEPSPTNIATYFSPSRIAAQDRTYQHPDVLNWQSHAQLQKSPSPRNPSEVRSKQLPVEDGNDIPTNNHLFSTRMGTPEPPGDFLDDDFDYSGGCDEEGMLEIAVDVENQGYASRSFQDKPSRPVFAETSGNSQNRPPQTRSAKNVKTSNKPFDEPLEELFRFPWSEDVKRTLKERFKLRGFRQHQLEAINATLGGKDTFVLMPTGGGKSLCYQLPSLIHTGKTRGVTVVISPLLSLMEDQVQHLRDLGIQAFLINGETSSEDRKNIYGALRERDVEQFMQLLYVTPEMLSKSQAIIETLEQLYRRQRLARIVIDEAHCVSQWGHDFRPDYKQLGEVRQRFPRVPVMALTATATENVRVDVMHNLDIHGCEVYTQSFNRANLYYEVRQKGKAQEDIDSIAALIKEKYAKQTGIIYCLSRKKCEQLAKTLQGQHRIKATHYHAALTPGEKSVVQKDWQRGGIHVIVATIAFGMGIDKANVRFVIHHSIPKSLEGYYQETGRAGRDGKRSGCYLYYGYQDAGILRHMIDDGGGSFEQKQRQHHMLRKIIQYCENRSDCRRVQVLAYFNERFHRDQCEGHCDNCNSDSRFKTEDFTEFAATAVSIVEKVAHQKVTVNHCMDIFRGAPNNKKIKDLGHNNLQEYGAGSDLDREAVDRLFSRLLSEDAIHEDNHVNKRSGFAHQYVVLGRPWKEYVEARRTLKLQIRVTPKVRKVEEPAKKKVEKPAKKKGKKGDADKQSRQRNDAAGSKPRLAYPMSTNVSSPVQAASKRKTLGRPSDDLHANGYAREKSIVSDPKDNTYAATEDDESDGFAPVREAGQPTRDRKKRELGPRITTDERLSRLNPTHQAVVESFVVEGKRIGHAIYMNKHLRGAPFTDTMLREMAIYFPQNEQEMKNKISAIDPDKVDLYARLYLKLIRDTQRQYEEMISQQEEEEKPNDPDAQNVIDLISEDEDEDEYGSAADFEELMDEDEDEGEPSLYFQPNPVVATFNQRLSGSQAAGVWTSINPNVTANKGKEPARKKSSNKRYGYKKSGDNNRDGYDAGRRASNGGVSKRRAPAKRSETAENGTYGTAVRGGGISMMPT